MNQYFLYPRCLNVRLFCALHLVVAAAFLGACQQPNLSQSSSPVAEWSETNRVLLSSEIVLAHIGAFDRCVQDSNATDTWLVPETVLADAEIAVWQALHADSREHVADFTRYRRQIIGLDRGGRPFINVIGIGAIYFDDTASMGVAAAVRREWRSVPILVSHPGYNQFQAVYDVSTRQVCSLRFGNRF